MDFIKTLFEGSQAYWAGGVSHSIFILALVITLGLVLGKIKVKNVSLGLTWVLIVGIVFGYFNSAYVGITAFLYWYDCRTACSSCC